MNEIVANTESEVGTEQLPLPYCGIIMPISDMGSIYDKAHWERVRVILDEAIREANYTPRLVSESEDIGVIHARIVQNLYDDPIVICDVSGKNANVMFELGLRLAFNKPTIVIKDDITGYSFDTSPMEHINYRSDLRFDDVRSLQKQVVDKITATIKRVAEDQEYSPFLGHFGKFKVTGLETTEIDKDQFILEQLEGIQKEVARLSNQMIGYQVGGSGYEKPSNPVRAAALTAAQGALEMTASKILASTIQDITSVRKPEKLSETRERPRTITASSIVAPNK